MRNDLLPKGRLEAFADGVLAIVITILVLELEVPGRAEGEHLSSALGHEWRGFVGYLISFVFVGGVWIAHSNATRLLARGDAILFRLNLITLFFVSLLPFTTSVMATHLGGTGEHVAVALYGLDLLVASLLLNALIGYAAHNRELVSDEIADEELRAIERQRRGIVMMLGVATGLAVLVPTFAVLLYLLAALAFIIAPLLLARHRRRGRGQPARVVAGS